MESGQTHSFRFWRSGLLLPNPDNWRNLVDYLPRLPLPLALKSRNQIWYQFSRPTHANTKFSHSKPQKTYGNKHWVESRDGNSIQQRRIHLPGLILNRASLHSLQLQSFRLHQLLFSAAGFWALAEYSQFHFVENLTRLAKKREDRKIFSGFFQ